MFTIMDLLKVIKETIEGHLGNFCTHSVVHYGDLVHLICDFGSESVN